MLPSKKILILLALLIVGISALAWYEYDKKTNADHQKTSDQDPLSIASSKDYGAASQIDSDGDGLFDWEESLYGTDPNKIDTDSDGTPDGKEIELGRNPLVKGPKDFLSSQNNPIATSTEKENLTLTDAFARNFFAEYMNLQQSGVKITTDNAEKIAGDYLKNATLPSVSAKQYNQTDLLLTDSDKTHIANYQTAMAAVFDKYWPKGKTNELAIMQKAFAGDNTKALIELAPIISAYQNTMDNILTLSVPQLAVSIHLNVLNSLATYIQTLKMIQLTDTDPLGGLAGLNAYQNNYANVSVSLVNMQRYFINSSK